MTDTFNIFEKDLKKKYDVVGLGNALVDLVVEVDDNILSDLNLNKGEWHHIDKDKSRNILKKLEDHKIKLFPGGSSANTLAGICNFGGNTIFIGKVGDDKHGDFYIQTTNDHKIKSKITKHSNEMTGHCITFITPDFERTFAGHLGAALKLEKEDIFEEEIKNSKILHIEGFQLDEESIRPAVIHALDIAKENNVKVSIDLSDPALIKRNLSFLKEIVEKYANIIFVNEDEAQAFTGKKEEEALDELYKNCEIAIVKLGKRGSLIKANDKVFKIDAHLVDTVNQNGAGDMYAAAILFGIINNMNINRTGKIASYAAAQVVSSEAARLNRNLIEEIERL